MDDSKTVANTTSVTNDEPGQFVTYVATAEAYFRRKFGQFEYLIDPQKSVLGQIAEWITFLPGAPPNDCVLAIKLPVALLFGVDVRRGFNRDALMHATAGRAVLNRAEVFRPTLTECEQSEDVAVEKIAMEIELPFPLCVVEFPPDYTAVRAISSPADGGLLRPVFAVVFRENGVLVVTVVLKRPGIPDYESMVLPVGRSTVEALLDALQEFARPCIPFVRATLNYLTRAAGC